MATIFITYKSSMLIPDNHVYASQKYNNLINCSNLQQDIFSRIHHGFAQHVFYILLWCQVTNGFREKWSSFSDSPNNKLSPDMYFHYGIMDILHDTVIWSYGLVIMCTLPLSTLKDDNKILCSTYFMIIFTSFVILHMTFKRWNNEGLMFPWLLAWHFAGSKAKSGDY